jgi:hypothetical protein
MRKLIVVPLSFGLCVGVLSPSVASGQSSAAGGGGSPNAVTVWNANAAKAAVVACLVPGDPLHESRLFAMVHLAIHDALNAIDRRFRRYVPGPPGPKTASPQAAVAAAAHDVLVALVAQVPVNFQSCVPASLAGVEADYTAALAAIPNGAAKTQGVAVGQAAAAQILALRSGDGSDIPLLDFAYPEGVQPGEYRHTAPFTTFVLAPGWAAVTPFVLTDPGQFRPGPPPLLADDSYTSDFNEVKGLGGDGITTPSGRTANQTEIAQFWVESAALQWNRIARTVSSGAGLGLWRSARLYALLDVSLVDAVIASWDAKYTYNRWRPITAIQNADSDGNPDTTGDPSWTPLVITPPFPEYDSVHAVQGGAAAAVLRRLLGTDSINFTTCSTTLPAGSTCSDPTPKLRHFSGFTQAARESGIAQMLAGSNFRNAIDRGLRHGHKIGDRSVNRLLQPTDH